MTVPAATAGSDVDAGPPAPRTVPTPTPDERRARASQSFWTAVVGVPAVFSVLRLGVEAGGELQTTLLLVANVGPVNLLAGFLTTAARLLSTGLVAVFALGAVLGVSVDRLPGHRRPLFARWADITPAWFVVASFLLALVTWRLLYLPLLLPAFVAAFQLRPERLHELMPARVLIVAALLGGYLFLLAPTLLDAWRQGEHLVLALLLAPPVLALAIAGPLPGAVIRPLASITEAAVLAMLVWAALPVITTPVLPLTVTTVETAPASPRTSAGTWWSWTTSTWCSSRSAAASGTCRSTRCRARSSARARRSCPGTGCASTTSTWRTRCWRRWVGGYAPCTASTPAAAPPPSTTSPGPGRAGRRS
ncbi:hypothetical protein [Micromonospora olivasterospora]|uniref:Uncharacterized protein n=1 Tax=Micromonospora olivasterospora TaxID=1880 RepID=A0A562I8A1_MICOL|nr:hypothetical protein [Micromonospora olivasterospora]TWH67018.1 hypothetical protein JD77_01979 [Micromonospora olivasterospora]